MKFHDITHDDMKNGTGLRTVLWVAGCEHQCEYCHNPITWDPNYGIEFTEKEKNEFLGWLNKPWTEGATFSGGDPLHPCNRETIGQLCKEIKENYPNKNIWIYTGYDLVKEENKFFFKSKRGIDFEFPWLKYIDVIIDGNFDVDQREKDIRRQRKVPWKGSSNQRTIDIQETLKTKNIVIIPDDYYLNN